MGLPLLVEVLPRFDVREIHDTWVPAPNDVVSAAVKQVTPREVRLLVPSEVLRGVPRLLVGGRPFTPDATAPHLETFTVGWLSGDG